MHKLKELQEAKENEYLEARLKEEDVMRKQHEEQV